MKKITIVFVFLLLFVSTLCGQTEERSYLLDRVSVYGKRTISQGAITHTQIDSLAMAKASQSTLSDLLARFTPIAIKSYGQGSLATVSFRGTGASHTQVEWNGININNPMLGQVDFSLIPIGLIDKVSLYHGGSSIAQSNGALGGLVSIGTAPQWDRKIGGELKAGWGSFGHYQALGQLHGTYKQKIHACVRYIYEQAKNNFEFYNSAVIPAVYTRQKNAEYQKHGATADLFARLNTNNNLSAHIWLHTANRNLPTTMSYEGKGRNETQNDHDLRTSVSWNRFTTRSKLTVTGGYSLSEIDYFLSNKTDLATVINTDSKSRSKSFEAKVSYQYNLSAKLMLRIKADVSHHNVYTLNKKNNQGYTARQTRSALLATLHHAWGEHVTWYALLKGELTDKTSSPLMPSIGLEVRPWKTDLLTLSLNSTRNYHTPSLNDLYWLPGGNPLLKPEGGYSGDLSASMRKQFGSVVLEGTTTGYLSHINDWIMWTPGDFMYWTAENIQKVFSRGIETHWHVLFPIGAIQTTITGNYAYTRTTNQTPSYNNNAPTGKQLIYIPQNKANAGIDLEYKRYTLGYWYSFTGKRYTTSDNDDHALPSYSLSSLTAGINFALFKTQFTLSFKIDNLFDKNYQALLWRAMPKRNYMFNLKISL